MVTTDALVKSILILAANPKGTSKLRLDEEIREIDLGLQRSRKRELFVLKQHWAVRPRDIYRSILDFRPQIIHFCGHGSENGGLVFEDENGETKLVSVEALANLFQLFSTQVECVLLNACYSEIQALAINQHIDYVIGMKQGIGDKAAISFAVGFYDALGAGESYEFAFNLGCRAIEILGMTEQSTPVIQKKKMTITDEQLQELIARICNNSDFQSARRRRDINRLLVELQRLPGLLKSSHLLYLEALDRTWAWVSRNICAFEAKPHLTIQESLVRWINGYLRWRIKNLYRQSQGSGEVSLDVYINESSENPSTLLEQLSDKGFDIPTLSGIDRYIEERRNRKIQKTFEKLERYVEADPEQIFQKCHPRNRPDCNCQFLCKRLLFKEPPDKFSHLSNELGINQKTLISHWKRKCLPLLQKTLGSFSF